MKHAKISLFTLFNHPIDDTLDAMLNYTLESHKITGYKSDEFRFRITFDDGTEIAAWNANKWYAWMSQGVIVFGNSECPYTWSSTRPRRKTMNKVLKAISEFYAAKYAYMTEKS